MNRIFALTLPAMMAILNLSSVAVLWFGGRLVGEGSMPIGNLTAFLAYILQILLVGDDGGDDGDPGPRAVASAERVEQVLDTVPAIADPATPRPRPALVEPGSVEFDDVSLRLPGQRAPGACTTSRSARAGRDERRSSAARAAARRRCST